MTRNEIIEKFLEEVATYGKLPTSDITVARAVEVLKEILKDEEQKGIMTYTIKEIVLAWLKFTQPKYLTNDTGYLTNDTDFNYKTSALLSSSGVISCGRFFFATS